MRIYHSIEDFPSDIKTIVTIGTFDGVHLGHRSIISRINKIAKEERLQSVILTLYPHPRHVLYPEDQNLRLINTIEEKIVALETTGLQNLIIHKFTNDFSRISSISFIRDVLVGKINMKYMVVGFDHHFGKNRKGTFGNLLDFSDVYDFKIERVEPQKVGGVTISSTKIRGEIEKGDMRKVNSYLCYDFSIKGKVVAGNGIGSKIGFPTANIHIANSWKILPKDGVYAVKVFIKNQQYFGMLNLGHRPSISDSAFVIEVHLFDFDFSVYDQEIQVGFIRRIRGEKKFLSLEKLKSQLIIDAINCKRIFNIPI